VLNLPEPRLAEKTETGTPAHVSAPGSARPGRWRLVFLSVYTPVWNSGVLLFVCLFLPLGLVGGCGTKTPLYPYEDWVVGVRSASDFFKGQIAAWPYLFALLLVIGTWVILLTRDPRHFRTLWFTYALAITIIVLGMWTVESKEFRERGETAGPGAWLEELWFLIPTAVLIGLLLVTYLNCRTWFAAALWVQLALALLSTAWFIFVAYMFTDDLLYGGKISIGCSGVLVLATAWERWRGLEELGVRLPIRRPSRSPAASLVAPAASVPSRVTN
jgi:hypothetical protein